MTWRFVAANFDQMHQNRNAELIAAHPDAELVGVCDEDPSTSTGSMSAVVDSLDLDDEVIYDDLDQCLETTAPDVVMGCPMNVEHARFVERVAPYDVHVVLEKPFAMTLADADRMLDVMDERDRHLLVNWPSMWSAEIHTVKELMDDGIVGDVIETQYYGGNAGAPPRDSWFYDAASGGGSLLDYLGYGATFTTWFLDGMLPETVNTETYVPTDLDVDVQSVSVCRYDRGLSTYQTTWRMPTHPWEHPTNPSKGYDIVGTNGSITTRDHDIEVLVQTDDRPEGYAADVLGLPDRYTDLVHYVVDLLDSERDPVGPPAASFCREAQRLIESARESATVDGRVRLAE